MEDRLEANARMGGIVRTIAVREVALGNHGI